MWNKYSFFIYYLLSSNVAYAAYTYTCTEHTEYQIRGMRIHMYVYTTNLVIVLSYKHVLILRDALRLSLIVPSSFSFSFSPGQHAYVYVYVCVYISMYYIRSMLRNCTGVTFTFRRFPDNFRSHSTQPEEEKSEKKKRDRGGNGNTDVVGERQSRSFSVKS